MTSIDTKKLDDLLVSLDLSLVEELENRRNSIVLKTEKGGKFYVLKLSNPSSDTKLRSSQLINEAKILGYLSQQTNNLLAQEGLDDYFGQWLLLKWLDGSSASVLSDRLRGISRHWPEQLVQMTESIVAKLSVYHQAGVLHGDLQASHFVLRDNRLDSAEILDWGLGRMVGSRKPYYGAQLHYVSPEVARGMLQGRSNIYYGVRSEIYSIGAVLFRCLSGLTPVNYGEIPDGPDSFKHKLRAVAENRLQSFCPGSNQENQLFAICQKCLMPNPSERYKSSMELLAEIRSLR